MTVLDRPESPTLAVTIIHAWFGAPVDVQGPSADPTPDSAIGARADAMEVASANRLHGDGHPANDGTSLSALAATLATTSFHMVEPT